MNFNSNRGRLKVISKVEKVPEKSSTPGIVDDIMAEVFGKEKSYPPETIKNRNIVEVTDLLGIKSPKLSQK